MLAGRIDGEQTAKGVVIPFTDLLIGARALSARVLCDDDELRHFKLIPRSEYHFALKSVIFCVCLVKTLSAIFSSLSGYKA